MIQAIIDIETIGLFGIVVFGAFETLMRSVNMIEALKDASVEDDFFGFHPMGHQTRRLDSVHDGFHNYLLYLN